MRQLERLTTTLDDLHKRTELKLLFIFTTKGADAVQGFLRNLTPQVVVLMAALVLSKKINFDLSNLETYAVGSLYLLFAYSSISNLLTLFYVAGDGAKSVEKAKAELRQQGVRGFMFWSKVIWRGKADFFSVLIMMGIAQLGFAVVVVTCLRQLYGDK